MESTTPNTASKQQAPAKSVKKRIIYTTESQDSFENKPKVTAPGIPSPDIKVLSLSNEDLAEAAQVAVEEIASTNSTALAQVKKVKCETGITLDWYQKGVVHRLTARCKDQRGLLVLHKMGSGKTMTTLATLINTPHTVPVTICCPKGLEKNFLDDINKFFVKDYKYMGKTKVDIGKIRLFHRIDQRFMDPILKPLVERIRKGEAKGPAFVLNDTDFNNVKATLGFTTKINEKARETGRVINLRKEDIYDILSKNIDSNPSLEQAYMLTDYNRIISYNDLERADEDEWFKYLLARFENSIVVLDEAHNLIELIKTDNRLLIKKAMKIRELFRRARNVILLTGTPIISNWTDLAELVNILAGEYIMPPLWSKFLKKYGTIGPIKTLIGAVEEWQSLPGRVSSFAKGEIEAVVTNELQAILNILLDSFSWLTAIDTKGKLRDVLDQILKSTLLGTEFTLSILFNQLNAIKDIVFTQFMASSLRRANMEFNKAKINPKKLYQDIAPLISYFDYDLDYTQKISFPTSRVNESRFAYDDFQMKLLVSLYFNRGLSEEEMAILGFATNIDPYLASFNEVTKQSFIDKGRLIGTLSTDNLIFLTNTENLGSETENEINEEIKKYYNMLKDVNERYNDGNRLLSSIGTFLHSKDSPKGETDSDKLLNYNPKFMNEAKNQYFRNQYIYIVRFYKIHQKKFQTLNTIMEDETKRKIIKERLLAYHKHIQSLFNGLFSQTKKLILEQGKPENRSEKYSPMKFFLYKVRLIILKLQDEILKEQLLKKLCSIYIDYQITEKSCHPKDFDSQPRGFVNIEKKFYDYGITHTTFEGNSITRVAYNDSTFENFIELGTLYSSWVFKIVKRAFALLDECYTSIHTIYERKLDDALLNNGKVFKATHRNYNPQIHASPEPPFNVYGCPKYYRLLNHLLELRQSRKGLPIVYSNFPEYGYKTFGAYLTARGYKYLVYDQNSTIAQRDFILKAVENEYFFKPLWSSRARHHTEQTKPKYTLARFKLKEVFKSAVKKTMRGNVNRPNTWKNFTRKMNINALRSQKAVIDSSAREMKSTLETKQKELEESSTLLGDRELSFDWDFTKAGREKETRPLCVLLHPSLTEGVDFKYSQDIIVVEPCLGAGKTDQVYARILRKYDGDYVDRKALGLINEEEKVIHQYLSSFKLGNYKYFQSLKDSAKDWLPNVLATILSIRGIKKFNNDEEKEAFIDATRRDLNELFLYLDRENLTAANFYNESALKRLGEEEFRNYQESTVQKSVKANIEVSDLGDIIQQYQTPDDIQYQRNNDTRDLMKELFDITAGLPIPRPLYKDNETAKIEKIKEFKKMWLADNTVSCVKVQDKQLVKYPNPTQICNPTYCPYFTFSLGKKSPVCGTCVQANPVCELTDKQVENIKLRKRTRNNNSNSVSENDFEMETTPTEVLAPREVLPPNNGIPVTHNLGLNAVLEGLPRNNTTRAPAKKGGKRNKTRRLSKRK